ncbi:hypothetical protein H3H37_23695 [Duganella sp. LX20W]|uniref:DUF4345 domain-containing protein n=1 Tax=Rugamonas brunnea TaxID=2758569 RepID=A0A7W2EWY0_9BURK|nr:hypothetical protein [Rugamonas brunnea]MBA5640070.1 hypothetical protein [Rugamonas brunnea]
MKLSFHKLANLFALLFLMLAAIWLWAPNLLLADWGVAFTPAVALVGRRGAAFYAGVAVMFFTARHAPHSPARTALIRGGLVICLMLAGLGVYELASGHATPAILVAVCLEVAGALALLYVGREQSEVLRRRR